MIIKDGFNNEPTTIKIYHENKVERIGRLWINESGKDIKETLSFITIDELLDLKDEIDATLQSIINKGQ